MKSVSFALLAGATLSSATDNVLYYPPQAGPRSKTSDITVHSGDTFNITWSTGYPAIDLRIEAYAADSNFTVTPFFNPGLEASSFFMYTVRPPSPFPLPSPPNKPTSSNLTTTTSTPPPQFPPSSASPTQKTTRNSSVARTSP